MKFNIEFVNTSVNDDLKVMAQNKLETLKKKYSHIINAHVFLKRERKDPSKGKICEIKLGLPGPIIFASSNFDTFEKAIIKTTNELSVQLKKQKDQYMAKDTVAFKSI